MVKSLEQIEDIKGKLIAWLSGSERVVIAGIGNPYRKDDFIGVKIVRGLKNNVSGKVYLIEAETVPESYLDQIITFNPTHILIIDAGIINREPGSLELFDIDQLIRKTAISTHTLPIRIFCDYLIQRIGGKIYILIIQPEETNFGEGLTKTLEQTAANLTKFLLTLLP